MAHSDLMALNGNFAQWQKTRGAGLTDVSPFNYYAVENFLKPYPIIDKEIRAGIVDKSQDGGIDAFYFFANRKYVFDDTKLDPQVEYKFNLILFQCKEGSGFSPVELGKVNYFADDLLDPTREEEEYKHSYHSKLRGMMKTFKEQPDGKYSAATDGQAFSSFKKETESCRGSRRFVRSARTVKLRHLKHYLAEYPFPLQRTFRP